MTLRVWIDGSRREFEDPDALARHLAYRVAEGIHGSVKCPSLCKQEFERVVTLAAGYCRELRPIH